MGFDELQITLPLSDWTKKKLFGKKGFFKSDGKIAGVEKNIPD